MFEYMENLLKAMRPAFSRQNTFKWFVIVFVGFVLRNDTFGVSSIVRALWLDPSCYACLLHFFHSTAWRGDMLLKCWWLWLINEKVVYSVGGRIIMVGDHTKTPKDGRRIPEVSTLRQDSETSSKPTYFRGHHWACIGLLINADRKFFATPLWTEIHRDSLQHSRSTRIVAIAGHIARVMGNKAIIVLDAFFAVGPVFEVAAQQEGFLHILTRAKKNVVAYLPPLKSKKSLRGRPQIYGKKLHLMALFDLWSHKFEKAEAVIYQQQEVVSFLTLDLIWKPVKKQLRFFLIETSRGRIILMTSDITMEPLVALKLYSRRVTIETMFDMLKNLLGAMQYHFWSKYLNPVSRKPLNNNIMRTVSSQPIKTKNTLDAIEKFSHIQLVVLGSFQLLACNFNQEICNKARCWLRTSCNDIPSEFVTRSAISNVIRRNLFSFGKDWITQLILEKQNRSNNTGHSQMVA